MQTPRHRQPRGPRRPFRRHAGLSLIELLVALAISALLLAATAVAVDASLTAYAVAAESASTQTATRMVTNRVLTLIRNATVHGPLEAGDPGVLSINGRIITTDRLILEDPDGLRFVLRYIPPTGPGDPTGELTVERQQFSPGAGGFVAVNDPVSGLPLGQQVVLGGVTQCVFNLARRRDADDVWVLERGSIDFRVQPDDDASLPVELGNIPPVRVVASTKPRRINR